MRPEDGAPGNQLTTNGCYTDPVNLTETNAQPGLTRDEAVALLHEWTLGDSLRRHARAVELVMRAAAHRYGRGEVDEDMFSLAGMLHDADYEAWPREHPQRIVAWLRERDERQLADAIAAHYTRWGRPRYTLLAKTLLACDELTGFVMACAILRPEGVITLTPKSVLKKLKAKRFAAGVERHEVRTGAEELGVELREHIEFVIAALKPHAEELGLLGTAGQHVDTPQSVSTDPEL